jgi:hypothetical protein
MTYSADPLPDSLRGYLRSMNHALALCLAALVDCLLYDQRPGLSFAILAIGWSNQTLGRRALADRRSMAARERTLP